MNKPNTTPTGPPSEEGEQQEGRGHELEATRHELAEGARRVHRHNIEYAGLQAILGGGIESAIDAWEREPELLRQLEEARAYAKHYGTALHEVTKSVPIDSVVWEIANTALATYPEGYPPNWKALEPPTVAQATVPETEGGRE